MHHCSFKCGVTIFIPLTGAIYYSIPFIAVNFKLSMIYSNELLEQIKSKTAGFILLGCISSLKCPPEAACSCQLTSAWIALEECSHLGRDSLTKVDHRKNQIVLAIKVLSAGKHAYFRSAMFESVIVNLPYTPHNGIPKTRTHMNPAFSQPKMLEIIDNAVRIPFAILHQAAGRDRRPDPADARRRPLQAAQRQPGPCGGRPRAAAVGACLEHLPAPGRPGLPLG